MEPSPEPSEHKEEEDEEWEVESYDEPDEFELLEPIEKLDYEQELSSAPFQVEHHGVLQNGLTYYVKKNSIPKDIILVNLIVKAGAVCEEENEQGVAHIIEHLVLEGYGYTNSDATEYLKAFKHQCGAHQQAKTYWDHTSYNFSVTNTEDLRKALALTAAISRELVVTSDELEKEKLIVIDELWHDSQIVEKEHSRIFSAQLYQGTKYAEPLGGTEKNIRDLSVDIVKGFYLKWYVPNNMAVIVVGDVTETQSIIGLIRTYFERQPRGAPQHLEFPLLKQCEPRLTTHVNSEILKVYVSFMFEKQGGKHVNEVFIHFQQILLQKVIVERLKKFFLSMTNPKEIQYSRENDSQMYSNFVVWVECEGCETIKVLETFLMEIARLRVHGIEENELSEGCVYWLRIAGAEYRNRLDHSSEELQNNYTRHFNYRECDLCPKLQAQLIVALTKSINLEKMKSFCELQCKASNLSVIILQSKNFVTQEDMKGSLQKITDLEKEGSLAQWSDEEVEGSNNLILEMEPESGKTVERVEHSDIGAVELILSNGMQVTYQCTKDDEEVRLSGFSYGGLSELAKEDLLSCLFSCEIGQNVLCKSFEKFFTARDKVGFNIVVDEYKRAFSANFVDSSYIKLALQIVYFLFTSDLEPEEEDLQAVVDDLRERLSPRHQHLQDILVNTAKEINSGGSCIYKPLKAEDLSQVDTSKAWNYFKNCFRDPSSFRVIMIGKFDSASVDSLLSRYLGGIPRPSMPIMEFQRGKLTPAPFHFPPAVTMRKVPMAMDSGNGAYICISFPLYLERETLDEDRCFLNILRSLMRIKVMHILRHQKRMVYFIEVCSFNPHDQWSSSDSMSPGMLYFLIHIGNMNETEKVVETVVQAMTELQADGPLEHQIQTALNSVPTKEEEERNTLKYIFMQWVVWSMYYVGGLSHSYQTLRELKANTPTRFNADVIKSSLKRFLPWPCSSQYSVLYLTC
ncbi:hypothetical protein KY284_012626 [Solanum tuberosum]|nr:hypothetical protein KY284_012626 [Solanum tuberosum]